MYKYKCINIIYVCMYACIYVMYVYTHVCMNVTNVYINVCMYVCIYVLTAEEAAAGLPGRCIFTGCISV